MKYDLSLTKWVRSTFLGWLIGIALILILASAFEAVGISNLHFFMGIGMGFGVGFMQWKMLNKIIPIGKRWIWYAMLGLTLPFLTFDLLPYFTRIKFPEYQVSIPIALGGISVGALQLKLLKSYTKKTDLWVVANILGWIIAGLSILCIDYTDRISSNVSILFALNLSLMLVGGIILGLISGKFLKKMLL